jgi:hypothetical protein
VTTSRGRRAPPFTQVCPNCQNWTMMLLLRHGVVASSWRYPAYSAPRAAPIGSVYWLGELDGTTEALRKLSEAGLWASRRMTRSVAPRASTAAPLRHGHELRPTWYWRPTRLRSAVGLHRRAARRFLPLVVIVFLEARRPLRLDPLFDPALEQRKGLRGGPRPSVLIRAGCNAKLGRTHCRRLENLPCKPRIRTRITVAAVLDNLTRV